MHDELFGRHDTVHISAIADVQEHVRDTRGRLLFKARQRPPYPEDLAFDVLLAFSHNLAHLFRGVSFRQGLLFRRGRSALM